jgi:hypothetical protein
MTLFSGTGSVAVSAVAEPNEIALVSAQSDFAIGFSLLDPDKFDLTGLLSGEASGFANLIAEISLLDRNTFIPLFQFSLGGLASLPVNHSGVLLPGDYLFSVVLIGSSVGGSSSGEFDFEFRLNEIAEPTSLWLLALGICSAYLRNGERAGRPNFERK